MKPNISDVEHVAHMLHARIDRLRLELNGEGGSLDRLTAQAKAGCFLDPETTEARNLASDAKVLRQIALLLEVLRAQFVANVPKFTEAAE